MVPIGNNRGDRGKSGMLSIDAYLAPVSPTGVHTLEHHTLWYVSIVVVRTRGYLWAVQLDSGTHPRKMCVSVESTCIHALCRCKDNQFTNGKQRVDCISFSITHLS